MWEFTSGVNVFCLFFAEYLFSPYSGTSGIVDLSTKNHMSLSCLVAEICEF